MKKNILTPHGDFTLNALRLLALGAVGYYFFKTYKSEGSLLKATGKTTAFNVNTDKIVDGLAPRFNLNQQQTAALKNVANEIKKQIINS